MSLNNKFTFLKDYLELNNYDFIAHGPLSEIFDSVFEFFNNNMTESEKKILLSYFQNSLK